MRNFIFLGLLSLLINTSCEPSIEDTNCSKDIDSQLAELSDLTLELLDYDYDFDEYCKFFKKKHGSRLMLKQWIVYLILLCSQQNKKKF